MAEPKLDEQWRVPMTVFAMTKMYLRCYESTSGISNAYSLVHVSLPVRDEEKKMKWKGKTYCKVRAFVRE